MKQIFLDKLTNTGSELDTFISRFLNIKANIGNGVGAGKLFERLFVDFVNKKLDNLYSVHLNLNNSQFIWDILISDVEIESKKDDIVSIIRSGNPVEPQLDNLLGNNWIAVSLKTYKNDSCQITTDYSYRTYLEDKVSKSTADSQTLNDFFSLLNKHDQNRYVILALNTYDNLSEHLSKIKKLKDNLENTKKNQTKNLKSLAILESKIVKNEYTFRLLTFDKKFDNITYKLNKKLSQYNLSIDGVKYFKVLYGKNQANPFQRGIWTFNDRSIEYFPLIKSGQYDPNSNYFDDKILSTINL
jgi:hypothetical protein